MLGKIILCARKSRICSIVVQAKKEDTMRDTIIYKILRQAEWAELQREGHFAGSVHDKRDGFIHMSAAGQLQGTLDKHYTDGDDVILAAVRLADIAETVKWEVSRGDALFPHLYRKLKLSEVVHHAPLKELDGVHLFPDEIP